MRGRVAVGNCSESRHETEAEYSGKVLCYKVDPLDGLNSRPGAGF